MREHSGGASLIAVLQAACQVQGSHRPADFLCLNVNAVAYKLIWYGWWTGCRRTSWKIAAWQSAIVTGGKHRHPSPMFSRHPSPMFSGKGHF